MLTTIRPDGANHPGQKIHLHLPNDSYWYLLRLGSGPHRRAAKNAKGRRVLQCKACPKSCCAPSTAGALTARAVLGDTRRARKWAASSPLQGVYSYPGPFVLLESNPGLERPDTGPILGHDAPVGRFRVWDHTSFGQSGSLFMEGVCRITRESPRW